MISLHVSHHLPPPVIGNLNNQINSSENTSLLTNSQQEPLIDAFGVLSSTIRLLPNPQPGPKTLERVKDFLCQVIPLRIIPDYPLFFLLQEITTPKPDRKAIQEVLLIGSGAINAIDPAERNDEFISAGAGQLLTTSFIQRLNKKPNDKDWRIILPAEATWQDTTNHVIDVLYYLADLMNFESYENLSLDQLATQLGILLDKSDGQYYVLRFIDANIDLAIGKFPVHCLFEDTNLQISIDLASIRNSLSNLKITYKTKGINFYQALTYRGKGIIAAQNPYEKDYRAIIHLIRRLMEGEICHSKNDARVYTQSFLNQFGSAWQYHAAKKISNIFQGHHPDTLRGMAWGLFQFEIFMHYYCLHEPALHLRTPAVNSSWTHLLQLNNNHPDLANEEIVKLRLQEKLSTTIIQAVIGIALECKPSRGNPAKVLGEPYAILSLPYLTGDGCHRLHIPRIAKSYLAEIDLFFDKMSNSSTHKDCLFSLFTTCFNGPEQSKPNQNEDGILSNRHAPDEWAFSSNPLLLVIHAYSLEAKAKSGCAQSQTALLSYAIPQLLCSDKRRLTTFGKHLAGILTHIAPSKSSELQKSLNRETFNLTNWLQILASTNDSACCELAANEWAVSVPIENARIFGFVNFFEDIWQAAPLSALKLVRYILDHAVPLSSINYLTLLLSSLNQLKKHINDHAVVANLEIITELATHVLSDSQEINAERFFFLCNLIHTKRPDLESRCLSWMPHVKSAQTERGISLLHALAPSVRTDEDRLQFSICVRQLFSQPGIVDFLFSRHLLNALGGTSYLKNLWSSILLEGHIACSKKLCFSLRWLESTLKDVFVDSPPAGRVPLDLLSSYLRRNGPATANPQVSLYVLQKLLLLMWKHPLYANEEDKKLLIYLTLDLVELALPHPFFPLKELAKLTTDREFLALLYKSQASARALFPLLKELVNRGEAWKKALKIAQELKEDQMIPLEQWRNTLSLLALLAQHEPYGKISAKLSEIYRARSELSKIALEYAIEKYAYESASEPAKAEQTLKSLLAESDKLSTDQKSRIVAIIKECVESGKYPASSQGYLSSPSFRTSMGIDVWLSVMQTLIKNNPSDALFEAIILWIQECDQKISNPLAQGLVQKLLLEPKLFTYAKTETALGQSIFLSSLEPYLSPDIAPVYQNKVLSVVYDLVDQSYLNECAYVLANNTFIKNQPFERATILSKILDKLRTKPTFDCIHIILNQLTNYLMIGDWEVLWRILNDLNVQQTIDAAYLKWIEGHPLQETSDRQLLELQLLVFETLTKASSKYAREFVHCIPLIKNLFGTCFPTVDAKQAFCNLVILELRKVDHKQFPMLNSYCEFFTALTLPEEKKILLNAKVLNLIFIHKQYPLLDRHISTLIATSPDKHSSLLTGELSAMASSAGGWPDSVHLNSLLELASFLSNYLSAQPTPLGGILHWAIELLPKQNEAVHPLILTLVKHLLSGKQEAINALLKIVNSSDGKLIKLIIHHAYTLKNVLAKELLSSLERVKHSKTSELSEFLAQLSYHKLATATTISDSESLLCDAIDFFILHSVDLPDQSGEKSITPLFKCVCILLHTHKNAVLFKHYFSKILSMGLISPGNIFDSKHINELFISNSCKHNCEEITKLYNPHINFVAATPDLFFIRRLSFFQLLLDAASPNEECHLALMEAAYLLGLLIAADFLRKHSNKSRTENIQALIEKYFLFPDRFPIENSTSDAIYYKKSILLLLEKSALYNKNNKLVNLVNLIVSNIAKISPKDRIETLKSLAFKLYSQSDDRLLNFYYHIKHVILHENYFDKAATKLNFYEYLFNLTAQTERVPVYVKHLWSIFIIFSADTMLFSSLDPDLGIKITKFANSMISALTDYVDDNILLFDIESVKNYAEQFGSVIGMLLEKGLFRNSKDQYFKIVESLLKFTCIFSSFPAIFETLLYLPAKYCLEKGAADHRVPLSPPEWECLAVKFFCAAIQNKASLSVCAGFVEMYPEALPHPEHLYFSLPPDKHKTIPKIFFSLSQNEKNVPTFSEQNIIHQLRVLKIAKKRKVSFNHYGSLIAHTEALLTTFHRDREIYKLSKLLHEALHANIISKENINMQALLLSALSERRQTDCLVPLFEAACLSGIMTSPPLLNEKTSTILSLLQWLLKIDDPQVDTHQMIQNFISCYICDPQHSFNTSWIWPLLSLVPSRDKDIFLLDQFRLQHHKEDHLLALEIFLQMSDDLYLEKDDLLCCIDSLQKCLNTAPKSNPIFWNILPQLLRKPLTSKLFENTAFSAKVLFMLFRSIPARKESFSAIYEDLLNLLLSCLIKHESRFVKQEDLNLFISLNPKFTSILSHLFSISEAVEWIRQYIKAWDNAGNPHVGGGLLLHYIRATADAQRVIPVGSCRNLELLNAIEWQSERMTVEAYYNTLRVADAFQGIFNAHETELFDIQLNIIRNLLRNNKTSWAVCIIEHFIKSTHQGKADKAICTLDREKLNALFNEMLDYRILLQAIQLVNLFESMNLEEHPLLYVKFQKIVSIAESSFAFRELLVILIENDKFTKEINKEKLIDLTDKVISIAPRDDVLELLLKLIHKYHLYNVVTALAIFEITANITPSKSMIISLYLMLQKVHQQSDELADTSWMTPVWFWILSKMIILKTPFNLSYLQNKEMLHTLLKDITIIEEQQKFILYLYITSISSNHLDRDQLEFLIYLRSILIVEPVHEQVLETADQKCIEHIALTKNLQLLDLLCSHLNHYDNNIKHIKHVVITTFSHYPKLKDTPEDDKNITSMINIAQHFLPKATTSFLTQVISHFSGTSSNRLKQEALNLLAPVADGILKISLENKFTRKAKMFYGVLTALVNEASASRKQTLDAVLPFLKNPSYNRFWTAHPISRQSLWLAALKLSLTYALEDVGSLHAVKQSFHDIVSYSSNIPSIQQCADEIIKEMCQALILYHLKFSDPHTKELHAIIYDFFEKLKNHTRNNTFLNLLKTSPLLLEGTYILNALAHIDNKPFTDHHCKSTIAYILNHVLQHIRNTKSTASPSFCFEILRSNMGGRSQIYEWYKQKVNELLNIDNVLKISNSKAEDLFILQFLYFDGKIDQVNIKDSKKAELIIQEIQIMLDSPTLFKFQKAIEIINNYIKNSKKVFCPNSHHSIKLLNIFNKIINENSNFSRKYVNNLLALISELFKYLTILNSKEQNEFLLNAPYLAGYLNSSRLNEIKTQSLR